MNINSMTIGQVKELASLFGNAGSGEKPCPFEVGTTYLIRTVTMSWHGTVKSICGDFLVLEQAAWIADTGRFSNSLAKPDNYNEVEPAPNDVFVNLTSIIDATETEKIKLSQK